MLNAQCLTVPGGEPALNAQLISHDLESRTLLKYMPFTCTETHSTNTTEVRLESAIKQSRAFLRADRHNKSVVSLQIKTEEKQSKA